MWALLIFGSGPGALASDAHTLGIDPMLLRDRQDEAIGVINSIPYTLDLDSDIRSLMSVEPNTEWYETTHHELGHVYYYMCYSNPDVPIILRKGANRAFLSPDGRWLAYVSNRTGQGEVWVQGYPEGPVIRVSNNGGYEPRWSADGKSLYYVSVADELMEAKLTVGATIAVQGTGFDPRVPNQNSVRFTRAGGTPSPAS